MDEDRREKWNAYQKEYDKKMGVIVFTIQKEHAEQIKEELKEKNVTLNELIKAAVLYYDEKKTS